MPNELAHLAIANHNQAAIDSLLPQFDKFSDWITTMAFYKALHVVEAVFANDPTIQHGLDHQNRERILKNNNKYRNIYNNYRPLYAASLVARYLNNTHTCFDDYLSPNEVRTRILAHYLHQVEQSAVRFLKNQGTPVRVNSALPVATTP